MIWKICTGQALSVLKNMPNLETIVVDRPSAWQNEGLAVSIRPRLAIANDSSMRVDHCRLHSPSRIKVDIHPHKV
jgi:hypothetical protein